MELPKLIPGGAFTPPQIDHITEVVFGSPVDPLPKADALFVFGGTHPGSWELTSKVYPQVEPRVVFVSGGYKEGGQRHASWTYHEANEADVIAENLVHRGVPPEKIVKETRSTNSLENVTFLQGEIRGRGIQSLVAVCKSYGVGRQARTIKKHLPGVDITTIGFDTDPEEGIFLTRENWSTTERGRARVWGEYVRNCLYARKGDILSDFVPPPDLTVKLTALERQARP